jgi:hypothetical protein
VAKFAFKDAKGHGLQHFPERVNISCNYCRRDVAKSKKETDFQFLSCKACDYDICKYCREAQAHNSPSCTHPNKNTFTRFLVFSKLRKDLTCSYCKQNNKNGMWYCNQEEKCNYTICSDCNLKNEIKCEKNHLLVFDVN